MHTHKIRFSCMHKKFPKNLMHMIGQAVMETLHAEKADVPCEVEVLFTDDERIHLLNKEFRNVDKSTDVLSFPMVFMEPGAFHADDSELDPESGRLLLGDVVLSLEHAKAQAREYGHSYVHETVYLTVHSMLHLLGYDHVDEAEEKARMRGREKVIMERLGI